MIDAIPFAEQNVAVLGLGRSGLAAAEALRRSSARVWAWDDDRDVRQRAADSGVPLVDLEHCRWDSLEALVLSPGIPRHHPRPHPAVALALAAGCEVLGDIELLARSQGEAAFIGITGTNGKSTTTALVGHILDQVGRPAEVGGNIGVPALEMRPLGAGGTYVLEMSSFQLELIASVTFDVAVLLNVSPDHLDRYPSMEDYAAAKETIFRRQKASCTAIAGIDDARSRAVYEDLKAGGVQAVIPVSGRRRAAGGVYAADGVLIDDTLSMAEPVLDLKEVSSLPGPHNWQNAAAAYAAAKAAGVPPEAISRAIRSFPGLAHRQELIAVLDGVAYVNDSKATNADAAANALASYRTVYWIAGGRLKEGGLEALAPSLDKVRHAFLIGEAADSLAAALDGSTAHTKSETLAAAVAQARTRALADGHRDAVVLLSPACSSFDQFKDFTARGAAFRELVEALPGRRRNPAEAGEGRQ